MNIESLRKLQDNQQVTYRIGSFGKTAAVWGQWQTGNVYVKTQKDKLITITIRNTICEEFRESDFDGQCFAGEEYLLEIK